MEAGFWAPIESNDPLSDHLPLFLSYANSIDPQSEPKTQRFFSSAKITLFNNELQKVNIDPVLKETDPDTSLKVLLKDYMNLFNKYFPKQVIKDSRKNHNWFDDELKNYCPTKKHYLRNTCKQNPMKQKDSLQKLAIFILERFNKKKQEHIKNKLEFNKNDIKLPGGLLIAFWARKHIPECKSLYTNTNKITDPQQLANLFNDHVSSIAYKYTSTLPKYENNYSEYLGNKIQETMYVWPTFPMEVKNILINSKPKLSAGFDEIPLKLLKSSPDNIIMALSHIFNLSLSTGKVISDFKIAKIIPLYKKGDASDINNYRPINLLSNISKILEKIMYRRVISFLNILKFFSKINLVSEKNVLLPKLFRFS